ncbi:glycosyltransferase family 2 protein [Paenibacillus sp. strain BS8-2]
MTTISLCMIVKNEEAVLRRCLDSVRDVMDEIIIVDTGSSDRTKEIAAEYTTHIYDFVWIDDFSAARNYAFSKGTMEYCMWLDADDILLPADRDKLKALKEELDPSIDIVLMKYNMGMQDDGSIYSSFLRERLIKQGKNYRWYDPVHEYVLFKEHFLVSDIGITHKKMSKPTMRNLEIFEKYVANGNELTERNWFYFARELCNVKRYDQAIYYYKKFLDTTEGLTSNYLDACMDLATCYEAKGDEKNQIRSLLRYMEFDGPRPEIYCKLGYIYKEKKQYSKAISWFILAPSLPKPESSWGAVNHFYWDYIPYMELCSCHYRLGDIQKAIYYNEKAAEARPDEPKIIHNRLFLGTMKQKLMERAEVPK